MTAVASPWGNSAATTTTSAPSLSDIMATEHKQQQQQSDICSELLLILPHLSKNDAAKLLSICNNELSAAISKAFDLGEQGLELLLHPPKSQEDIDHDLAVALSLAGEVDQTTSATTATDLIDNEEEEVFDSLNEPVRPFGVMRHDKLLSEQYNSARLSGRPGVGDLGGTKISNRVYNSLSRMSHNKMGKKKGCLTSGGGGRGVSKDTTSGTSEGVLDQRTRKIILNLINKEVLESMGGVIATGKEASAYSAFGVGVPVVVNDESCNQKKEDNDVDDDAVEDGTAEDGAVENTSSLVPIPRDTPTHLVVKIFRTTLSQFKNRADYVDGDSRYAKSKFKHIKTTDALKVWSIKEYRNLIRMHRVNIPCPKPFYCTDHTLVMSMICCKNTNSGVPALQLKESKLSPQRLRHAFIHVAVAMRSMYQRAKLVHGDLSEFNVLYVGGKIRPIILIDVGQAVDLSHPKHIDYLRRDCTTILGYFMRKSKKLNVSLGLPSVEELLMYVIMEYNDEKDESLTYEQIDQLSLKRMKKLLSP